MAFWPPNREKNKLPLFKRPVYGILLRQPEQTEKTENYKKHTTGALFLEHFLVSSSRYMHSVITRVLSRLLQCTSRELFSECTSSLELE